MQSIAAISTEEYEAIAILPPKEVKRLCAWCGKELAPVTKDEGFLADDSHGICAECGFEALPANLHGEWKAKMVAAGMLPAGYEPLRVGERVFREVGR